MSEDLLINKFLLGHKRKPVQIFTLEEIQAMEQKTNDEYENSDQEMCIEDSNFNKTSKYQSLFIHIGNGQYILDIGNSEVRNLVIEEIKYICEKYDISEIHVDDYFYPYSHKFNIENYDIDMYNEYRKNQQKENKDIMSLSDWRRDNANKFIKSLHDCLKSLNKLFSVSPFGVWKNIKNTKGNGKDTDALESYDGISCDSKKWIEEGWVDCVIPQIYWCCGFNRADFVTLSDWWNDIVKMLNLKNKNKVKLVLGLAAYRIDENSKEDPWKSPDEIKKQIEIAKSLDNVSGVSFFRYEHVQKYLNFLNS